MADITFGYGKDYDTFKLAYAAGSASGTDRYLGYFSEDGYGTEYDSPATYDKGGEVIGVDDGITIIGVGTTTNYTAANQNLSFENIAFVRNDMAMSTNIGTGGVQWDRCYIDSANRFLINNAGITGTFRWTNCINLMSSCTLTARPNVQLNNCTSGCKVQIYNSFFQGRLVDGYTVGNVFVATGGASGTVDICNSQLVYKTANFYTGALNITNLNYDYCDFVTANTGGNPGSNNQVKNVYDMGIVSQRDGCMGSVFDKRTIRSVQRDGSTTSPLSVDLTSVYTTDLCGTTRPATAAGYSVGSSYDFELFANADFPEASNVLNTDTVDNQPGLWQIADSTKYLEDETYGVDGTSEVGSLALGSIPNAPTITRMVPTDGTITITVSAVDETFKAFALYKNTNKSADWSAESATFSRTGSGTIAITGLTNGISHDIITYHKDAAETVIGRPSNIYSGYPDADNGGQYRHDSKIYERDNSARALLELAKNLGELMTFRNDGKGTTGDTVYGIVAEQYERNVGVRQGAVDEQFITVSVPRQNNFPPDNFDIKSTIEVDENEFQIRKYSTNPNNKTYAAEFVLICSSIRGQEGY